jgi:uncharacterized protein YjbI with pentapeptide repeats
MLALACAIAITVLIIGLHVLHFRAFKPEPLLTSATLYNLIKIAFGFAAGVGGVVALVTAYRRQRVAEIAQELAGRSEQREVTRLLNERYATAAGQLGHDSPAIRLAGVYAMASLADDWPEQQQTCVDVLCAYLRMPYQPRPSDDAPAGDHQAYRALSEVRRTVITVITARLQQDAKRPLGVQDWRGLSLDFTGAAIDGGNFSQAQFTGQVSFKDAEFSGGDISFYGADLSGPVSFDGARFYGGAVRFDDANFSGYAVTFYHADFSGGEVSFDGAKFSAGVVRFDNARFGGASVSFRNAHFSAGTVRFDSVVFNAGTTDFESANFSGTEITFWHTKFSGGTVSFPHAGFSGGSVSLESADFSGGTVDFSMSDWTHGRPLLPAWQSPPASVLMPLQLPPGP